MIREVLLVGSEAERLKVLAAARDPFETGGILLGVLSGNTPWVTRVLEVPPLDPRPTRYELPAGTTHALVAAARMNDPRLGYVGDWHSHPGDAGPSDLDLRTLAKLARKASRSGEPPPILLVVRRSSHGWVITASSAGRPQTALVKTGVPAPQNGVEFSQRCVGRSD